jgi:hypothetical protein
MSCRDKRMRTSEVVEKGHTSEAPRDFISSQDVWSRRSFVKAGVSYGGILLLNSHLTKALVAIQQTSSAKEPRTDSPR